MPPVSAFRDQMTKDVHRNCQFIAGEDSTADAVKCGKIAYVRPDGKQTSWCWYHFKVCAQNWQEIVSGNMGPKRKKKV